MQYKIRQIRESDNSRVEEIIRSCLIEYGADHNGTVWSDPNLGRFSFVYAKPGRKYFVAEDASGTVVAGCGIGELPGAQGICELQRMFAVPEVRGTGAAAALLERALAFAGEHYEKCYLETLSNMKRAMRFYEKHGFARLESPISQTGHFACDRWYLLDL